jgi:alkanesulfonate monooxygenase SsuD/methylene tetrahydromethanopterin reductase-like flavin-dependent oxidoreductase (luciferase family)
VAKQPMKFGFTLPNRGVLFDVTTPAKLLDAGARAEESGRFDAVWVGDSLFAKPRLESLALLNALAARTSKVKLGVGCMASFTTRNPIVFAYEWASFDQISNGRSWFVACTGIVGGRGGPSDQEGAPFGIVNKQRAGLMTENIQILRKLWGEDNVSFRGERTSFENLTLAPKPVQQPCPIWIAANPGRYYKDPGIGDRALRRVVELSDGWMTVNEAPGAFETRWTKLREFVREAGRDPDSFPNILYHNININPDYESGFDESSRFLDLYYGPVFSDESKKAWVTIGSPEQCVEQLRVFRDLGVQNMSLRITGWKQEEQLEQLIRDVLPYVND